MSDLLQLAVDAQGGFAVWRSIRQIDVQLSISGGLWKVKGHPEGLPNISMRIDTQRPKLAIWPFKGVGDIGNFTPDQVWIEHDGMILEQRSSPRRVICRTRANDAMGQSSRTVFHGVRFLELLQFAVSPEARRNRKPRDRATCRKWRDLETSSGQIPGWLSDALF